MRFASFGLSIAAFCWGLAAMQSEGKRVVVLSGDVQGYLSPCGCSSPMMGGIRRMASVVRSLETSGQTTFLENGGMVDGVSRQDEMKAETLVQTVADLDVAAVNVGLADARLGPGSMLQLSQLSDDKLISLSLAHPRDHNLGDTVVSGPFLVGGATDSGTSVATILGDTPVALDASVKSLVDAAGEAGLKPILMLQGSRDTAVALANRFPGLALIQYSSYGEPPQKMEMVGRTVLATTGDRGKHIVEFVYRDGRFTGYRSMALGPEYRDDPDASRYYAAYLRRVTSEKLLDKVPRAVTPAYAGSWACISCHPAAGRVWKSSGHRHALSALQDQGHALDPDCVSCHVTGLASTKGYRSTRSTPQFAGVGCESCHGPALAHAQNPSTRVPKLTEAACTGCHNTLNSPNFDFATYWPKIKH